ncbi:MAG: GNAT family N-acetyltransferase [Bacteroidetes bacterium]|nr:GNAT family N-acetyltransferase [Bacteroidota bacterium]
MTIRQATIDDISELAKLFSDYRVFYGQDFDLEKSVNFLTQRLNKKDSVIFVALDTNFLGFTQLYPSFTSIGVQEIWILNDLFVNDKSRQKGVAQMLINHVLQFSKDTGRRKVILSTAYSNDKAQQLYEKLGFTKTEFYNYEKLTL